MGGRLSLNGGTLTLDGVTRPPLQFKYWFCVFIASPLFAFHCSVLYCTIRQGYTVRYYSVLYCTVLFGTILYYQTGHDMEWKTIFPYFILAIFFHSIFQSILKIFHSIFHSILKLSSIFHSILPYQDKFRPEATRNLHCTYATLSISLKVAACKGKQYRTILTHISSTIATSTIRIHSALKYQPLN